MLVCNRVKHLLRYALEIAASKDIVFVIYFCEAKQVKLLVSIFGRQLLQDSDHFTDLLVHCDDLLNGCLLTCKRVLYSLLLSIRICVSLRKIASMLSPS